MIFDIVKNLIMEWTMPNESRICRICRGVLIQKKKNKSVAGQFAAVKYRSETYQCWTQNVSVLDSKLNRKGYGVDKYCVLLGKKIIQDKSPNG